MTDACVADSPSNVSTGDKGLLPADSGAVETGGRYHDR